MLEQEIKLLQGAAALSIELKNREVLASEEERKLYFEIRNKGQELAADVSITLQVDSPAISFPNCTKTDIDIIESGKSKEISFSITPHVPAKTILKGTLTFSDRVMEGKRESFAFPVTILKKSAEFKEIKNPYIVGQPLKGNAPLFFGREDAHEFIDKNILASGGHHTIVCHGLRRTGKTSLLYRIGTQGLTDKRLIPINIDMQGIDDEKDFYHTLSNAIIEELSLQSASPVENFYRFKGFLKDIKPQLGKRIIVLMVDEFEELQMRVEERKISKSVFSNIRHLMQHEEKLIFLFCGTHQLQEMSADYWSIFFNTAIYFRISHLKREDAIRLIKEPVKDQLTYDDLAVEQILKMTNGQPYLTQLICRTLVNDLNENKKRNDALIDDVDDVVEHIINEGKEHFSQHIWDESSQLERLIISAAAEELTHKQLDHVGPDAIFDKIKQLLPDFSRKQSMEALDKLVSKEILAERNLRYWFPVNLLRKWIAARYPLRKVREEI
ncbi:MAG: AAA family ATPase [Candidatus Aminicenantes bacterium]|nr:AAA family ATPase [Candidatus Aminicenantes bacterium]NIM82203.1 AAA family ATPase [Candidatus Aminicenantes bacterium]NIN21605.1 AAA family ATPase [Candidatus Aminicenantes bacterium]NIN45414.1 AAA family ATPase [Candidatus Aminicenantes bacterium]NIN88235.1 AAA family ATPase [Candidatus Aminicenantes bacterium]